ncbi:hypothetical protein, partial [Pseudomonas sp. BAV 4579]
GAGGGSDLSLLIGTRKVALEIPILEQGELKTKGPTFSNCEENVKTSVRRVWCFGGPRKKRRQNRAVTSGTPHPIYQ